MGQPNGPQTLVQELFTPQDFTAVLVALHAHADEIAPRLQQRAEAHEILEAAARLETLADKTRQTLQQVISFLPRVDPALLPASYLSALKEVDDATAPARTPADLVQVLLKLRETHVHEAVPGFAAGVRAAADILTDAIRSAHGRALGPKRPTEVARACAHSAVAGGMAGALSGSGPIVGAIVGGIAGSARECLARP